MTSPAKLTAAKNAVQAMDEAEREYMDAVHAWYRNPDLEAQSDSAAIKFHEAESAALDASADYFRSLCADAQPPAAGVAVVTEEMLQQIDGARRYAKLMYGFMLDCNAIGAKEAGVNLAHSIKDELAALTPAGKRDEP
jgi:hypothetical protein